MNKTLTNSLSGITVFALLGLSNLASADHQQRQFDYARVTEAKPIYQTVTRRYPVEQCYVETVRVEHRHDDGATLVGGLIGAAIGHNLGHGKHERRVGTVAGAIIGASIADNATRHKRGVEYRDVERCNTRYDVQEFREVVGYDVTYRYHGETYRTRMDSDPGERIRVAVSVRPVQ